ncbi:hypothetical protein O0L34_g5764 [Tuta absoluta]|nr:hypothetical protein O0L34_g5764 [Tuta absoluta]
MNKNEKEKPTENPAEYGWGFRHVNAIMLSMGLMICYGLRVCMSLAIVSMTDPNNENSFDWSLQAQSTILSSFFWGYVVLQFPGGLLAGHFGGKILMLLCVGLCSATLLILPLSAYYGGWLGVCAVRALQGLTQGVLMPTTHHLIGKWVPVEERGFLGTFIHAGTQIGTFLQLIVAGYISDYWGWPYIFYTTGVVGLIWTFVYFILGADCPYSSRIISEKERSFIRNSLGHIGAPKKLPTPWRSIWTSVPFLAVLCTQAAQGWGYWTLMTEMPSYMAKVLGVNIKANGILTALPYLAMYLMSYPFGYLTDLSLRKGWLSLTASRKISNNIAFLGPAFCFIGITFVSAGKVAAVVSLLTAALAFNAAKYTGYMLTLIDLAPNFAGEMMGFSAFFANTMGIVAPLAAGAMIKDETNPQDWHRVFYVAAGIYIFCNLVYQIFITGDIQPWNEVTDSVGNKTDQEAPKQDEKTQN